MTVMLAVSTGSWLAAFILLGRETGRDVLFGMIGPLAAATWSWVLIERTHRRDPGRVMALMVGAFAGKMVFFGAYVPVMLRVAAVHAMPFVTSFTSYFIALYLIEALYLRRLFTGKGG